MIWNMMFQWMGKRLLDIFIITTLLAAIVFFFWAFGNAITPMQELYQLSRG